VSKDKSAKREDDSPLSERPARARWFWYLREIFLIGVACLQLWLAHTAHISPWAGGLFTDNANFFEGLHRSYDPLATFQLRAGYTFLLGVWLAADTTYDTGTLDEPKRC